MITYNKNEDPSKTLDQMCVILKARMANEAAVDRYEHRNDYYQHLWEEYTNDVWDSSSSYNNGGKKK